MLISYVLVLDNQNLHFHSYFPLQGYLRGFCISKQHLKQSEIVESKVVFVKNIDKGKEQREKGRMTQHSSLQLPPTHER